MIRGTILATMEMLFPAGTPSLKEFAQVEGRRRVHLPALGGLAPGSPSRDFFEARLPGPRAPESSGAGEEGRGGPGTGGSPHLAPREMLRDREEQLLQPRGQATDRRHGEQHPDRGDVGLRRDRRDPPDRWTSTPEDPHEVDKAHGEAPQPKSRRPHNTGKIAEEIQKLIDDVVRSADTRRPYRPMDVKRILEKNYQDDLEKHHGGESIALSTVSKYMGQEEPKAKEEHLEAASSTPSPSRRWPSTPPTSRSLVEPST